MPRVNLRKQLRNQTIYQIFPRNYSEAGNFQAVYDDLGRIKDLGVDIIYFLPINPIGEVARKGSVGSPYAIKDYRLINKDLGTVEDFYNLINKAHDLGMKVMIDIVFNHTSRDSTLLKEHPEYFYYRDGKLANRVGDWSDVGDLDLDNEDVRKYLIDTLIMYAKLGVDGFRCDVAPLVPLSFWLEAVEAVDKVNNEMIWLSESIEPSFIKWLRSEGHLAHSDGEMYEAFDVLYNYDIFSYYHGYFKGENTLDELITAINAQEVIYPADYLKMRCLENHDQERAHAIIRDELSLINFTAYSFFAPGLGFLYAGQEVKATHKPNLFEKDPIDLEIKDEKFYNFIKRLIAIKKHQVFKDKLYFNVEKASEGDVMIALLKSKEETYVGIFNLSEQEIEITLPFEARQLKDLISDQTYKVKNGKLKIKYPLIAKI